MLIWSILLSAVALIYGIAERARRNRLNKKLGVSADWGKLRITGTELIQGYRRKAARYPLRGLEAWVEHDGQRIHVVVEGRDTSVVESRYTRSFTNVFGMGNVEPSAQEFVAALNLASQRA
ncbi:hypothetical protein [Mycobacterium sp.]|uniref:hypothetical protein n=1 Tax=Mycobacterium sp. TaxID=1785 RepID=UPI002C6C0C9B|nr:hypothetical protein [Mycobacterium sp.]HTQ21922.1 hypothetical protein [Mycobacterium sp.]